MSSTVHLDLETSARDTLAEARDLLDVARAQFGKIDEGTSPEQRAWLVADGWSHVLDAYESAAGASDLLTEAIVRWPKDDEVDARIDVLDDEITETVGSIRATILATMGVSTPTPLVIDLQTLEQVAPGRPSLTLLQGGKGPDENPYLGDAVQLAQYRKARRHWEREGKRGPPPLPPTPASNPRRSRRAALAW